MCRTDTEIISVGTELLLGQILNTNARDLCKSLAQNGANVFHQSVVGDNPARLKQSVLNAARRSDLVLITGGLGPTLDDITKQAVAEALGLDLIWSEDVWRGVFSHFELTGRKPTENNRRQALVFESGKVFENRHGTAPGLLLENEGTLFVLLPGPPREMLPMWQEQVLPYLVQRGYLGSEVIHSRIVRVCGMGESAVEDLIQDLIQESVNPTIAPYAGLGEVQLRITAKTASRADAELMLESTTKAVCERLGHNVFGFDDDTLESVVGMKLAEANLSIAVAESCTGGLLGHRLTTVSGSSRYFEGGIIAYSNDVKTMCLGVRPETLGRYGAVSAETAREMADGVRREFGVSIGVAITGVAGPDGGTPEKPVGKVFFGLATAAHSAVTSDLFRPPRKDIQWRASQQALAELWFWLVKNRKESGISPQK